MKKEPDNPLGMVPDPISRQGFVFPITKCTRERRLFFKRANEIHALLFITKHAYDETNKIYQQRIPKLPKMGNTPQTNVSPAHTMRQAHALLANTHKATNRVVSSMPMVPP